MVTQATSPYFSNKAFTCINRTIQAAGFSTLPYHNQIPTMGEWGWILAAKNKEIGEAELLKRAKAINPGDIETRFFNRDAMLCQSLEEIISSCHINMSVDANVAVARDTR